MPPRSAALQQRGWITRWEVVTFVECGGCNYKGTKMHENQRQGFISGKHLRNVQYSSCLEVQRYKENTVKERGTVNVKYSWYERKDTVERISEENRKRILCPEYRTRKKQLWQDWRVAACPVQEEAQQNGIQTGVLRSITREGGTESRHKDI